VVRTSGEQQEKRRGISRFEAGKGVELEGPERALGHFRGGAHSKVFKPACFSYGFVGIDYRRVMAPDGSMFGGGCGDRLRRWFEPGFGLRARGIQRWPVWRRGW